MTQNQVLSFQMTHPLITCGFTTFNAASTVARAVQSALEQRYRPIEILIVDDGSTDDTMAVLQRLQAAHSEVRVLRQLVNGGVGAARSRIVQEARGEFVAFFDDDDESLPERLTSQLLRIVNYERTCAAGAPVVCHAARLIRYPSGATQVWRALGANASAAAPRGSGVARTIMGVGAPPSHGQGGAAATCSQMARVSVYRELGGFDPTFRRSEDDDFVVRAAIAGAHFVGVGTPLVIQVLTATSDKSMADQRHYGMKLLEKHKDFLAGSYDFARCYYEARYALMAGRHIELALRLSNLFLSHPLIAVRRISGALRNVRLHSRMGQLYVKAGTQR